MGPRLRKCVLSEWGRECDCSLSLKVILSFYTWTLEKPCSPAFYRQIVWFPNIWELLRTLMNITVLLFLYTKLKTSLPIFFLVSPYRDCSRYMAWLPVHMERTNTYDSIMSYYSVCNPVTPFHYLLMSPNCSQLTVNYED